MTPDDLDFVLRLAGELYPDHPESRAAFMAKLAAAPDACRIADPGRGPVGYCVALWATRGRPPKLDQADYAHTPPLTLHLHDVALEPSARGIGLVGEMLVHLVGLAGSAPLSLVAVNGTHGLWRRNGFADATAKDDVRETYGADAIYMERPA